MVVFLKESYHCDHSQPVSTVGTFPKDLTVASTAAAEAVKVQARGKYLKKVMTVC